MLSQANLDAPNRETGFLLKDIHIIKWNVVFPFRLQEQDFFFGFS